MNPDEGYGRDVFGITPQGEVKQVTKDGLARSLTFAPDGNTFLVLQSPPDLRGAASDVINAELVLATIDANTGSRIATRSAPFTFHPSVSPDGTQYAARVFDQTQGVSVIRVFSVPQDPNSLPVDGQEVAVPTDGAWSIGRLEWSPTGTRIAYVLEDAIGSKSEVHVVDLSTGTDQTVYKVAEKGPIIDLTWNPDGASFFVVEAPSSLITSSDRTVGRSVDVDSGKVSPPTNVGFEVEFSSSDGMELIGLDEETNGAVRLSTLSQTANSGLSTTASTTIPQQSVRELSVPKCVTDG